MTTSAAPPQSAGDATLEAVVDSAAALLRLSIAPEWREDVMFHLRTIMAAAQFVEAYPLDDEREAAPVFVA